MAELARFNWKNTPTNFPSYHDRNTGNTDPGPVPDTLHWTPPSASEVTVDVDLDAGVVWSADTTATDSNGNLSTISTEDHLMLEMGTEQGSEVTIDVNGNCLNVGNIVEVRTEAEMDAMLAAVRDVVIIGFGAKESAIMKTFNKTVEKLRVGHNFAHTNAESAMAKLGHEGEEGVVLFRPRHLTNSYEDSAVRYAGSEQDEAELVEWIKENKHGLVGVRTRENRDEFKVSFSFYSTIY